MGMRGQGGPCPPLTMPHRLKLDRSNNAEVASEEMPYQ